MTAEYFDIGTTGKLTGISPTLLRVWGLRYGWPKPHRRNGHRYFSRLEIEQLKRVAELLAANYGIRELIEDGELKLPATVKQGSEKDKIIADLRNQVATLRDLMNQPPTEYWTQEARIEREEALARCTGGDQINEELHRLREEIERCRALALAATRPALQVLEECGAMNRLRANGRIAPGDSLEVILKWLWHQIKIDERTLADERNAAREEVQNLSTRQGELVRRLDQSQRMNQALMSREMPALLKRATRAEKKLEKLTTKGK